mmetsp:Transcript_7475/g.18067  ORF Transcript_7475/g.18067 Transcript_7475/m.18067 type:complete len:204 (+) Transcript_7475:3680-4291(+)
MPSTKFIGESGLLFFARYGVICQGKNRGVFRIKEGVVVVVVVGFVFVVGRRVILFGRCGRRSGRRSGRLPARFSGRGSSECRGRNRIGGRRGRFPLVARFLLRDLQGGRNDFRCRNGVLDRDIRDIDGIVLDRRIEQAQQQHTSQGDQLRKQVAPIGKASNSSKFAGCPCPFSVESVVAAESFAIAVADEAFDFFHFQQLHRR